MWARTYLVLGLLPSLSLAFMRATMTASTPTVPQASSEEPRIAAGSPRKIGLIIEPTPFTHVSGYQNRFNEMLKHFSQFGMETEIMTVDDKPEAPDNAYGYPITTLKGFRFFLYNQIALTADTTKQCHKVMTRFKPEIIHITSPGFWVFNGGSTARDLNVPLVLSYHTDLAAYAKSYTPLVPEKGEELAWNLLRYVHNQADLTLVTSPQLKEKMEANGIQRVSLWNKGIDADKFNPRWNVDNDDMRMRLTDGHPEAPLLLYVGRLGAEKRLKDLKEVLQRVPEARLAFVGMGPVEKDLKKHFKGTNTVFTGLLQGEMLSKAFAAADIFCMPSDSETLGFVVIEAMASGVPVVAARAGGIPSIIDHERTGYLVEPGNMQEFAQRVQYLIDNPEFRKELSQTVRIETENWSWAKATEDLINVQYVKATENFQSRPYEPVDILPTNFDLDGLSEPTQDI